MPDGLRRAQTTKLRMNTVTAAENLTDISYLKVCKLLKAPLKTLNKHKTRVCLKQSGSLALKDCPVRFCSHSCKPKTKYFYLFKKWTDFILFLTVRGIAVGLRKQNG